jgi:methionine synthase / methylenetetrahydrofolate reductase(NADPH)
MAARTALAARIAARPLLLDGAMGTLLHARGVPQRASLDELVESRPDLIGSIHREYIAAGADVIETATFGANRLRLEAFGLADRAGRLNRRAAQVAREAREVSGRDVLVAGSVGPPGPPIHAPGAVSVGDARDAVREQVEGLLEGGIDLVIVETASEMEHLLAAVETVRALCDLPVMASMTFGDDLVAVDGTTPEEAVATLSAAGVAAIGVNCGAGPVACLAALERMPRGVDPPLLVMPNAGLPGRVAGRFVYSAGPDYFGEVVQRFLAAGARVVGGCCGTTPEHIAQMRQAMDREAARAAGAAGAETGGAAGAASSVPAPGGGPGAETGGAAAGTSVPTPGAGGASAPSSVTLPAPAATAADGASDRPEPTALARHLAAGRFVVSVEIDPPRSVVIERTLEAARLAQEAGADLVNISDSAMARVRMGAMAVAFAIQGGLGVEALVHFTTRDRNLMALESELLGAHALGIRNILALTGDPPRVGDQPGSGGIWDIDSTGLIAILRRLDRGEDQAGRPIGAPAGFTIACALDPTAADLDREVERLASKLAAGADLVMTQPIYGVEQWQRFMDRAAGRFGDRLPVPVLLGVLPLHTSRHAEFLHHEVPGITIPEAARAAMQAAGERGSEVGLEMSLGLVDAMADAVAGIYVMPSFGRYELAAELVRRVREARGEAPPRSADSTDGEGPKGV